MPFTFAHPAAAVPLRRPLGRYGVLSALAIGSLAPDLAYFLPLSVSRNESHSLTGLLWFSLPVGLVSYVVFHILLKGPLLGLLPPVVFRRLGGCGLRFRSLPSVPWAGLILSLLCGAMTHLLWDAFTHDHAPAVTVLPLLQAYLFSLGGYPVHVYKVLQHGSTGLGFLVMSWWLWQWLKEAELWYEPLPVMLSPLQRGLIAGAIVCFSAVAGLWAGVQTLGPVAGVSALRAFAREAVLSGLLALGLAVAAYSVAWHAWSLRGHVVA